MLMMTNEELNNKLVRYMWHETLNGIKYEVAVLSDKKPNAEPLFDVVWAKSGHDVQKNEGFYTFVDAVRYANWQKEQFRKEMRGE